MPKKIVPNELLECKAFNHAWEPCAPFGTTEYTDALFLVCVRCQSEKIQGIGRYGYLDSTMYRLSKAYEDLKLDYPDLDRQAARLELFNRQSKRVQRERSVAASRRKKYNQEKDKRRLRAV